MEEKTVNNDFAERNLELGYILNKYYSVKFSLNGHDPVYMFKFRDFYYNGLCILVKEDFDVLKCLKINETINMQFNPSTSQGTRKNLRTRISDIANNNREGFNGHCLVGLSIIQENDDHS